MPTINELKVVGTYDGRSIDSGVKQSSNNVVAAAGTIKKAATEAEDAVKKAMGGSGDAAKKMAKEAEAAAKQMGKAIRTSADEAATAVKASMTKAGDAYKVLPIEARKALDEVQRATTEFQQKQVRTMQGIGTAMSLVFTAPILLAANEAKNLAGDFEQTMDVLQQSLKASDTVMAQVKATARELGADMTLPATSAVDAAKAMDELARGGLKADQVMAAARGTLQLAAATGIEAAEAAKIQARALSAFSLEGEQATHVADLLARAAYSATGRIEDMAFALQQSGTVMAKSGQSIDATITAITQLAKAGIVGQDAGTSLKQMFLRLEEAGSMKKTKDVLHALGIEVYDSAGRMKTMRDIIAQFGPVFEHMTEKQRNAALSVIFGSDAIRAAQVILGGGVKAYDEMRGSIEQQGAAAELAAARNKGLKGALDGLQSAWETLLQDTAEPVLKPLANFTRGVGELVNNIDNLGPAGKAAGAGLALILAGTGPVLIGVAAIKNALITLGVLRAASTAQAMAQAGAEAAVATSATAAAVAEAELAAAEGAVAIAGTEAAAAEAVLATSQTAVGASAVEAAGGISLMSGALAILSGPIGLVAIGIVGLSAAIYGLYKWSIAEEDQARENVRAFNDLYEAKAKNAKASVELAAKVKPLLSEYLILADNKKKTNDESKREQKLANDISVMMPTMVKGYDRMGNAILDVAAAHREATKQANNQYDAEMALSNSRLQVIKSSQLAQKAGDMQAAYGIGVPFNQIRKDTGSEKVGAFNFAKMPDYITKDSDFSLAIGRAKNLETNGKASIQEIESAWADAEKIFRAANDRYRKVLADTAEATRSAKELREQSKMTPQQWAAKQDKEAKDKVEADRKRESAADKAYQAKVDAQLKAAGYHGVDDLTKAEKEKKGKAAKDAEELSAKILVGLAKGISTPSGEASCAYFAAELLKKTGAKFSLKGFGGGAEDLRNRVIAGGGKAVDAAQAQAGDMVWYYDKSKYGAKDKNGVRSGYHVGVYRGDGYVVDSSDGSTRDKRKLGSGAHFLRPARDGKYDNTKELAIDVITEEEKAAKKVADEAAQQEKERADAITRLQSKLTLLKAAEGQYADALGLTVEQYKKLNPEQKKRVLAITVELSKDAATKDIEKMKRAGDTSRIKDPTQRAVAEFANSLTDRKDLTWFDKARMIEAKRNELVRERSDAWDKELGTAANELEILKATTEEEKIRLKLKHDRPELNDDQRKLLASGELSKLEAVRAKNAQDSIKSAKDNSAATDLQIENERAIYEIQKNGVMTDLQKTRAIEEQNAQLDLQRKLLELNAKVAKKELTQAEADQIAAEFRKQSAAEHSIATIRQATEDLAKAQDKLREKAEAAQQAQLDKAKDTAEKAADILMRPFQDGLGKGLKGFWDSIAKGWRETVRQMFLDWAKSQLMRALEPKLDGGDVRRMKADKAAKSAAETAASLAQLAVTALQKGSKNAAGDQSNIVTGGCVQGPGMQGGNGIGQAVNILSMLGSIKGFNWFGMHFAQGGVLPDVGSPVLVGEHGPELVQIGGHGRVYDAGDTRKILGGGGMNLTINQTIVAPNPNAYRKSTSQEMQPAIDGALRSMRRNFQK